MGRRASSEYGAATTETVVVGNRNSLLRRVLSIVAIAFINSMMNYDRAALDGVIPRLQQYFSITDSRTALLQTLSTVTSSVALVVVGVIGDRVEKRSFLLLAVFGFLLLNGLSVLIPNSMYWLFLVLRTTADIGHSIAGALTPVIISDFFVDRAVGRALVANTLGGFVGMLISSSISSVFLTSGFAWQAALLPALAIIVPFTVLLFFAMPKTSGTLKVTSKGYVGDIKHLLSIKSYSLIVCAASLNALYGKAVTFWSPTVIFYGWSAAGESVFGGVPYAGVMTINSMLGLAGAFSGVPIIMWIAESWQFGGALCLNRRFSRAFPLIVSILVMFVGIFAGLQLLMLTRNFIAYLICHFAVIFIGSPIASLLPQLVLNIAPRGQRASAYALMTLVTGLVSSPSAQIIGMISDAYRGGSEDVQTRFNALLFAFLIEISFLFASSILYFTMTRYYPDDVLRKEVEDDAHDALLGGYRPERSGSIVERAILSRRTTMETQYAI